MQKRQKTYILNNVANVRIIFCQYQSLFVRFSFKFKHISFLRTNRENSRRLQNETLHVYCSSKRLVGPLLFHSENICKGCLLTLNVLQLSEKQEQPCQACGAVQEMKSLSSPLDAQTHPSQPIPLSQLQMPSSTNNKVCFVLCFFLNFRGLGL
jgi:hypothetical protein